jgi:hypothetical protein
MSNSLSLNQEEVDAVLSDPVLKNLAFEGSIRWMGVLISFLRKSSIEFESHLVIAANELEDAIEEGDPVAIWVAYKALLDAGDRSDLDLLNMPLGYFGRELP